MSGLRGVLALHAMVYAVIGCLLIFFPQRLVDRLGLPDADPAIYANLAGAAMLGLAVALARASRVPEEARAVVEGVVAANVLSAVVLIVWLTALDNDATSTGKAVLWVVCAVLVALAGLGARLLRERAP